MTHYEMLAVLPGTLTEVEITPIVETIKETVEKSGGTGVNCHNMGKSRLAYPMKHIRYGYFYLVHFQVENKQVGELQRRVNLMPNLLRVVVQAFDPGKHSVDTSTMNLTPIENVVTGEERPSYQREREPRRELRRETFKPVEPVIAAVTATAPQPTITVEPVVDLKDIEEKLDEILEKDLKKI